MTARVLLIALDAADALWIERGADEGWMPTFERLRREGATLPLEGCQETLPGAVWPEIATGITCGKLGQYFTPRQLISGESRVRPLVAEDMAYDKYFWTQASDAGRQVAVIDVPETCMVEGLNGISLHAWGQHDTAVGIGSYPPELLDELRRDHPDHPMQHRSCDPMAYRTGCEPLRQHLVDGIGQRVALARDLLGRQPWDLFICGFGEMHCAGHQFWVPDEPNSDGEPPEVQTRRAALVDVYRRLDQGVGELIDAVGPDCDAYVLATHGMGPHLCGPQLLPGVLSRFAPARKGHSQTADRSRALHSRLRQLPLPVKRVLKRVAGWPVFSAARGRVEVATQPFESSDTRAAAVWNNMCGAVRLNLVGRDPFGCVEPGEEADELLAEIAKELRALRQPQTGEPIVDKIHLSRELFGPDIHPNTPDLICTFRKDLGPLDACESPSVGLVQEPINSPGFNRYGDHRPGSRIWRTQPAQWRIDGPTPSTLDIAPTILQALGMPVPAHIDGAPLVADKPDQNQ